MAAAIEGRRGDDGMPLAACIRSSSSSSSHVFYDCNNTPAASGDCRWTSAKQNTTIKLSALILGDPLLTTGVHGFAVESH